MSARRSRGLSAPFSSRGMVAPPLLAQRVNLGHHGDTNKNNTSEQTASPDDDETGLPVVIMVRLISVAITILNDPRGSTLKDIRKVLCSAGVINETTDIRQSMIVALKLGLVARPVWAVKAGLYGRYVHGDGIPIFAGRKSLPKSRRHRSSVWVSTPPHTTSRRNSTGSKKKKAEKKRIKKKVRFVVLKRKYRAGRRH